MKLLYPSRGHWRVQSSFPLQEVGYPDLTKTWGRQRHSPRKVTKAMSKGPQYLRKDGMQSPGQGGTRPLATHPTKVRCAAKLRYRFSGLKSRCFWSCLQLFQFFLLLVLLFIISKSLIKSNYLSTIPAVSLISFNNSSFYIP